MHYAAAMVTAMAVADASLSGADASRGLDHAIQLPGGVSCIFHSRPASDASLFEKLQP
jgi:hypothetical protein